MNADFDNLRRNIAANYNALVDALGTLEQRKLASHLGNDIAGLLALYDQGIQDLSHAVTLVDPFEEEEP
jgi:hypothetical protein